MFDPRDERVRRSAEAQRLAQDRAIELARPARKLPAVPDATNAAKPVAELQRDRIEAARSVSRFDARAQPAALTDLRATISGVLDSLRVTTPGFAAVAGRFSKIQASLAKAREALSGEARESPRVRYGLRAAVRQLASIAAHVQAAEGRLVREVVPARPLKSVLAGIAHAQGELRAVQPRAAEARKALSDVTGKARHADVRAVLREFDLMTRESARAEVELGLVEGRTSVLAHGAALVSGTEPAAASVTEPGGGLTEDDLRRLGSGLDVSRGAPQLLWSEGSVNAACERARVQGGVTDAEGQAHLELAQRLLEGATSPVELRAADIAALLKEAGVPLEQVDPQQLEAAARYVATARTTAEQAEKLRKSLDGFQALARIGEPRLSRQEMVDQLWAAARVPGHALQKLSDADLAKALQQVTAAVNGGPGEHQLKLGSYNLKLTVGASGTLASSSCQKPSFFSKVGSVLKKVAPIALTVMSFIPVTAPFALVANAALSTYNAIKAKSLLGFATAAVGMVGAGASLIASRALGATAAAATRVSKVATSVSRTLQGVSSLKQGNLLGGLAAIGSGIAGGFADFASTAGDGLRNAAAKLDSFSTKLALAGRGASTVDGYRSAGRAVSEAKAALRQAEASGDAATIAAARQHLAQAERAKTSAVLGTVASAASLAADARASYSRQPGQAVDTPGARLTLDVALRTAWRGLNVAQAIHDRDYAAAGVSALGLAAVARQATGSEPSKGLGLTDATNMADAALGYHQASRGEAAANAAVADAERALRVARSTGDPAAIRQAEANLQQTRRAREGALMGGIAAGETLLETAAALGQKRQELGQVEKLRQLASQRGEQLMSLLQDPRATDSQKREALAALVRLAQAGTAYEQALGTGNVSAMRMARAELEAVNEMLRTRPPGSVQVASLGMRDTEPSPSASGSGSGTPVGSQATGAYRVAEGDSLWRLAKNYGITVEELLAVNPGLGPEGRFRAGEVIRIPMPERTGTGTGGDAVVTIEIPPPQGMGAASPQTPSREAGSRSAEGWGSFWAGVIGGDFSDNDSWSKTGGQVLVGLVPWAGQAADARDTLAALDQVRLGRPGAWLGLLAAGVAWIPGAGDALKGAIRGGRKVAGEAAEAALEQGAKRVGTDAAEEAAETAARGTSPAGAAGTIGPKSTGAAEAATGAPPSRPSWQTSEGTISSELKELRFKEQKSYRNGKEVPYGTPGSVRPDLSHEGFKLSVDVKNYDVASAKGRYRLVQDVLAQATKRSPNLPPGMRQGIVIDIRGQTVSERLLDRLVDRIVKQSGGTIGPQNIFIQR